MTITIETKFNIGDAVYVAEFWEVDYANPDPYIIVGISAHINEHAIKITYRVEQNEVISNVSEDFLFATYEECTKWCEKHNK